MKLFVTAMWKDRPVDNFSTCGYTVHSFWKESVVKFGGVGVSTLEECDAVCIFVTYLAGNFVFDEDLATRISESKKPIILFDYSEYGGHHTHHLLQYNLYGFQVEHKDLLQGDYRKTHEFLLANQSLVKCYFKRELSAANDLTKVPFRVVPLEFVAPVYCDDVVPDTKEQYYARPCIIDFIWGFSNLSRPFLHGELLLHMQKFNCKYALSIRQATECLKTPSDPFILLTNVDWYERINTAELMNFQRQSHMVIDMYGCGLKCFRNVESTLNCLSVKQDPSKLVWTYPWEHGVNCITLPTKENSNIVDSKRAVDIILNYWRFERDSLYSMYLKSIEMNQLYSPKNYVPNCIVKNIRETI